MRNLEEIKELLIVVDMVNGFVNKGALADPYIQHIIPDLKMLIEYYKSRKDAQVVFKSFVIILSFTAIGIPNKRLSTSTFSNFFASSIAASLFNVIKAFKSLFFSILSNASNTKSSGLIS